MTGSLRYRPHLLGALFLIDLTHDLRKARLMSTRGCAECTARPRVSRSISHSTSPQEYDEYADLPNHRHERACQARRVRSHRAFALLRSGLFEAELERIFYKTWVWVAHESELPKPGDFVTTTIGRQPVIVVRDKTGP